MAINYILFVCGHNAGRSQMAQAFFNAMKGRYHAVDMSYQAISAGTRPGEQINPVVVQAMKEIGIDMSDTSVYYPKGIDNDFVRSKGKGVQRVIVACHDRCELPPEMNLSPEYWNLPDPHGQPLEKVRGIRDLTKATVAGLIEELAD